MFIQTNIDELNELAKYFNTITNILISIYDDKQNLLCSYPNTMCDFCTEIRKNACLTLKCKENDKQAFEICRQTRKTYIYTCHMGLTEVATPIIYNNIIIGYMLFGQITDKTNSAVPYEFLQNVAEEMSLDVNNLTQGWKTVQCFTTEYIHSIAALLEMCANYIWLNSIISVRNEGISHNIDAFIQSNLNCQLSVDIFCEKFHISKSALFEIAKKNFGCSIMEYVQHCRVNKAKELLKKRNKTVTEIAECVGIPDLNYFVRFFKKHVGITPKQYQIHN